MKLKEKLADNFIKKFNGYKEAPADLYDNYDVKDMRVAYEVGFEKAREMARNIISSDGNDPTGHNDDLLSQLGEEEVDS